MLINLIDGLAINGDGKHLFAVLHADKDDAQDSVITLWWADNTDDLMRQICDTRIDNNMDDETIDGVMEEFNSDWGAYLTATLIASRP